MPSASGLADAVVVPPTPSGYVTVIVSATAESLGGFPTASVTAPEITLFVSSETVAATTFVIGVAPPPVEAIVIPSVNV